MYITLFSAFLAFLGIGVVDPILPVIATQIGAKSWEIELLFTAYILTMAVVMVPAGIAAGKFGEKRIMTLGLLVVAVAAMACSFSDTVAQISLARAGWGLGNALFFATAMILLIMLSPDANKAINGFEAVVGLGMATGPLLGGLLGEMNWRYPFMATSILVFAAFLLTAFAVKQPKVERQSHGFAELVHLVKYPPFLWVALSAMVYYYGFFTVLAYSPLLLNLSAMELGFVFFGWGLLLAVGSAQLSHWLETKYPTRMALLFGLFLFAIIVLGIFITKNPMIQLALVVLSGLACGLNNALFTTYVIEVSPYERRITTSAYNFIRWFGAAIGPVSSGFIAELAGPTYPYLVSLLLVLVGLIALVQSDRKVYSCESELDL